jgi:hypothetical protein
MFRSLIQEYIYYFNLIHFFDPDILFVKHFTILFLDLIKTNERKIIPVFPAQEGGFWAAINSSQVGSLDSESGAFKQNRYVAKLGKFPGFH